MATSNNDSTGNQTGSKQDAGIKISQFGYDAKTAPDYGLLFDSSWPSQQILAYYDHTVKQSDWQPIYYVDTGELSGYLFKPITCQHNLGHVYHAQAYIIFASDNSISAPFGVEIGKNAVVVNPYSNIYGAPLISQDTYDHMGLYRTLSVGDRIIVLVYNIDIEAPMSYDFNFGTNNAAGEYDKDVGIKVVVDGKDINSNDLRDFLVHSRASSPMVMYIGTNDELTNPSPLSGDSHYLLRNVDGGPLTWNSPDNSIYRYYGYELCGVDQSRYAYGVSDPLNGEVAYIPMTPVNKTYGAQDIPPAGYIMSTKDGVSLESWWNHNLFTNAPAGQNALGANVPNGYTITNSLIVMRAPIDNSSLKKVTI